MPRSAHWLAAVGMVAQCSLLTSLDGLSDDGGPPDVTTEAASDAVPETSTDAGSEADVAEEAATYNDMTDPANWTIYDLSNVATTLPFFNGTAFDGRHVYFAPGDQTGPAAGLVFRYDTTAPFMTPSSWDTYATWSDGGAGEPVVCSGGMFAAPYVYFMPLITECCGSGHINRVDSTKPFGDASSWSSFDTTTLNGGDNRFLGATFDGRYAYFVPQISNLFTKYDTTASFDAGSSYELFDFGSIDAGGQLMFTAIFDGHYVYVIPSTYYTAGSVVIRYDTTAAFTSGSSYTTFDTTMVNTAAKGFSGGAFDGRYLYLVPGFDGTAESGLALRYDTQAPYTIGASWEQFDMTVLSADARDFSDAGFDGRYIYYVPNEDETSGVVVRYDTTASFTLASSWQTFDTRTLNPSAEAYSSAVFDGRYVYFEPGGNTIVARFDARNPPALPPGFSGSFF